MEVIFFFSQNRVFPNHFPFAARFHSVLSQETNLRSEAPEFVPGSGLSGAGKPWTSDRLLEGKPWMDPQCLRLLGFYSVFLGFKLRIQLGWMLYIYLSIYLPTYLSIYRSIYLSIDLSIYLSDLIWSDPIRSDPIRSDPILSYLSIYTLYVKCDIDEDGLHMLKYWTSSTGWLFFGGGMKSEHKTWGFITRWVGFWLGRGRTPEWILDLSYLFGS